MINVLQSVMEILNHPGTEFARQSSITHYIVGRICPLRAVVSCLCAILIHTWLFGMMCFDCFMAMWQGCWVIFGYMIFCRLVYKRINHTLSCPLTNLFKLWRCSSKTLGEFQNTGRDVTLGHDTCKEAESIISRRICRLVFRGEILIVWSIS